MSAACRIKDMALALSTLLIQGHAPIISKQKQLFKFFSCTLSYWKTIDNEQNGKVTYPSVCCRVCRIVLICWKWPDISVDKTISMTKLRNSLRIIKRKMTDYNSCILCMVHLFKQNLLIYNFLNNITGFITF